MDYLTNFYKNRCEQLQEQLIQLQNLLNEDMEIAQGSQGSGIYNRGPVVPSINQTQDMTAMVTKPDDWWRKPPTGKKPSKGKGKAPPKKEDQTPQRKPWRIDDKYHNENVGIYREGQRILEEQGYEAFKKWLLAQNYRWHADNPFRYGTEEFFKWEADWYGSEHD